MNPREMPRAGRGQGRKFFREECCSGVRRGSTTDEKKAQYAGEDLSTHER